MVLFLFAGCANDLGQCDDIAARRVVFAELSGQPAFEGQALLDTSCGNGAFCHGADAQGSFRYGAPNNLGFDVRLACDARFGGSCDTTQTERLQREQRRVSRWRHVILDTVRDGSMPPGRAGRDVVARAPSYLRADGTPLPTIDSPEGRAVLRNWLACGNPVVEMTSTGADPRPGADCADGSVGDCIVAEPPRIELAGSTFDDLYAGVLGPWCSGCHTGTDTGLDLSTPDVAHAQLLATSTTEDCSGRSIVSVGDPANSLLIEKMGPAPSCGSAMPVGGPVLPDEVIAAFRTWIESGAAR